MVRSRSTVYSWALVAKGGTCTDVAVAVAAAVSIKAAFGASVAAAPYPIQLGKLSFEKDHGRHGVAGDVGTVVIV